MKKVIVLAIISLFFMKSNAQLLSKSLNVQAPNKSVVVQNIDTIQSKEYDNIKDYTTVQSQVMGKLNVMLMKI